MGNNSSNPYPKYQFPYRQPVDFSWCSYIEFCSCQSEDNINKNFQDNYRNKTIDLEGYITQVSDTQAKLLLDPSDSYSTNSEVTLHMNKEVLDSYGSDKFVLKQVVKFRGKFTSIGQIRNHQMELVKYDPNIRPELEITYEHFLSLFGSKAQKQADYYFHNYFRNRIIQVKGTIQGPIPNVNHDQHELIIPFELIVDDPNIHHEQVKLLIDQIQSGQSVQNVITLRQLRSNIPILITVKFHRRGNPHILSLVSIDHVFNRTETNKGSNPTFFGQSGFWGVVGSSIIAGFDYWRRNRENKENQEKVKNQIKQEYDGIKQQQK
ncbi:MAG: hypothetical protein EZS28_028210, partial [Streblomastix strix]